MHLNFAWHIFQDRNMISYVIVTHKNFPDTFASNFLRGLSSKLYQLSPEFRQNPQQIQSMDTMARHVINELQASFDVNGGENFLRVYGEDGEEEAAALAGGGTSKADSI